MTTLFCNIAWMDYYAGRNKSDPPLGGGGFPRTQGYCGEECNFVECDDGYVYGHFETIKNKKDRKVKIERLGAGKNADFVDGVTVVWTAPKRGNDPRTVIGWFKDARVYRNRQPFNGEYPSSQHEADHIDSYRVRARIEDAVLLPVDRRVMDLQRGEGWSGQASWWYADDTKNKEARAFVESVVKVIDGGAFTAGTSKPKSGSRKGKRAGPAASSAYVRYIKAHEIAISPQHDRLQKSFQSFLRKRFPNVSFPASYRDDLRYTIPRQSPVMVEVKPTEPVSVRYAIRTAIGQLMDYKQNQQWTGRLLIVVSDEVQRAEDRALALENGFGLAWPDKRIGFKFIWPAQP
jgi:hypothetical protein